MLCPSEIIHPIVPTAEHPAVSNTQQEQQLFSFSLNRSAIDTHIFPKPLPFKEDEQLPRLSKNFHCTYAVSNLPKKASHSEMELTVH